MEILAAPLHARFFLTSKAYHLSHIFQGHQLALFSAMYLPEALGMKLDERAHSVN